ncbi:hypothetical protein [Thalassobellus suaedae]|uniref:HEAT repeat domain-containing protein n=1 Tax=Thalassobellus suaedae TaxID=3074124 RepID=A0ABY9Y192_9FLAO|nr:hypothetical protein RHP49_13970 [Flavobacteriaceae bacterium HL-DH10]
MKNKENIFLKRLNENPDYHEFWQDFHVYCKNFEIQDKEYFVETLPLLYNRIKNDMANYAIYDAIRKFALEKPDEAIVILEMIEQKGTLETLDFSASIFGGLSQSKTNYPYKDKILSFIMSSDEYTVHSGISAAYQIMLENEQEKLKFLNAVHENLVKIIERDSIMNFGIIARFYNKYLNTIINAKEVVILLLEKKNVDVQNEVARSLNAEFKFEDDPDYFKKSLNLLTFTEVKYQGIYSTINYRLKDTLLTQPDIIIGFINNWVQNNRGKLKSITALEVLIHELYSNHPKTIEKLFLDWLNSDNNSYKIALQFVISDLSSKVDIICLPKELLKNLSETDSLYIVFMIVGYILDYKYASEMLYNILEVNYKNERIRNHIASLFAKYLIINYYSVTDILKNKRKTANKIISSIIDQIIDSSEHYYKQVSELELINEFEPSDKRMNYFLKQQNVQMQKLMDASDRKKDSFLDMLTSINLRAGKSFFSKYKGEYSQESEMQSFRSSVEVARVQYIDEIGQEKLRLMWQNIKRDELPN